MNADIRITEERCKGCWICIEVCQADVLGVSERTNRRGAHPPFLQNIDNCIRCGLCEMLCPDYAIFIVGTGEGCE